MVTRAKNTFMVISNLNFELNLIFLNKRVEKKNKSIITVLDFFDSKQDSLKRNIYFIFRLSNLRATGNSRNDNVKVGCEG